MPDADRPRVLIDGRLLAYRHGGIQRYAAALGEWLPRVAPEFDCRLITNRPTEAGLPLARVRTPPHFRFERWTLGVELAVRRPVLVHSTDFIAPVLPAAARVVTVHDLAFLEHPEILDTPSRRYYGQLGASLRAADRVITVSSYTATRLDHWFDLPPARVAVIPNGIDPERFTLLDPPQAVVLDELGADIAAFIGAERPLILAVGTVEPRKGYDLLLDSLEQSVSRDMSCVVAGQPGWHARGLEHRLAAAEATGRVRWLRQVSDRALAALYASATLLALPSLDEGFGLPALEAMACGLPVVAAAAGALPELLGGAGVLVEERSPAAWAEALAGLALDAPRRAELARLGRERARHLNWRRTAEQTAAVYREVLA
ncbi:MAG TPA: glycosyltransferase family 1 protein [Thermomicrobiaceae bacterium]|nr:glycosyltransferase family 1 protein [Thermomicrobiaceae bacterium]